MITHFEENLNVRWNKAMTSCEKSIVFSSITHEVRIRVAVYSIRALIVYSIVIYFDVMSATKSGSVRGTCVHCMLPASVLCQLHRIVSFDVVEGEEKCFAG